MTQEARILLVDDSEDARDITLAALAEGQFLNVATADSAASAYAMLGLAGEPNADGDGAPAFDLVLLDSPPVLRVSDSVMLARRADAIVLVAKSNSTLRSEAVEAARRLRVPGGSLAFSVVSGVPAKAASNKYYAGYRRLGGGVRLVTQNGGAVVAPERL